MNQKETKLEFLKNFRENELIGQILIPLFESMGFDVIGKKYPIINNEIEIDLIIREKDNFGDYIYTIVEVKSSSINLSIMNEILFQFQTFYNSKFLDKKNNTIISPNKALLVVIGKITHSAIEFLEQNVREKSLQIKLIDSELLLEMMDRYLPHFFFHEISEDGTFQGLIGKSPKMLNIFNIIEKVARTDSSVFIFGETGTGKELVARTIHKLSNRKDQPFIPLNCGALPSTLLESELFGFEKGAFTGAVKSKPGVLELAEGGTLYLDEIIELELNLQAKLLRIIQEGIFRRIGGTKLINVDIRIIAATSYNIERAVKEKKLREDLFYRLNVITIHLPPLRERKEDILLLANYYIKKFSSEFRINRNITLTDRAKEVLTTYDWPGNVRELANRIQRALLLNTDSSQLDVKYFDIIYEKKSNKILKTESKESLTYQIKDKKISKSSEIVLEFFYSAGFLLKEKIENNIYLVYSQLPGFKKYKEIPVKLFHTTDLSSDIIRKFHNDCEQWQSTKDKIAFISIPPQLDNSVTLQILVYKSEKNFTIVPFTMYSIEKVIQTRSATRQIRETIDIWKGEGDVFDISTPIRDPIWFFGRERIIDEISEYVYSLQFVGIFGLRKMGKTSLLHQLMNRMRENIIAYIDLQSVSMNVASLFSRIANEFISDIQFKFPEIKLPNHKRFKGDSGDMQSKFCEFIYELHRKISKIKKDIKLLLFIDEIDYLMPDNSHKYLKGYEYFLSAIRGIAQNYVFFVTVVSGVKSRINDILLPQNSNIDNPTYNFFKEIHLSYFEKYELEEMINRIGTQIGVTFLPDTISLVFDETSGHPYISRLLCSATMKGLRKKVKVTPKDVKNGISIFYNSAYFEQGVRQLEYIWKYILSNKDRQILIDLEKVFHNKINIANMDKDIESRYKRLIKYGILSYKEDKLVITPKILRSYLKNKGYI